MAKNAKANKETFLDYDKRNDILYIYNRGNFKGNIDIGDFILDLDSNGNVLGLEILDASANLQSLNITKSMLSNIQKATLKSAYKKDSLLVGFTLQLEEESKSAMIALPVASK